MLNPEFKLMGAVCKRNASLFYKNYGTLEMALPLGEARDMSTSTDDDIDDKNDKNDEKDDLKDKKTKPSKVSTHA